MNKRSVFIRSDHRPQTFKSMAALQSKAVFLRALHNARVCSRPYRHWLLAETLAPDVASGLKDWPHPAPEVACASGRREENNATRRYVDAEAVATFAPARALAETLQDGETVSTLEAVCDVDLSGTCLRIEYAQDREGFWLEPHTDIGVKAFTMFIYLAEAGQREDWGTDIYADPKTHAKRLDFADNAAMIFIPAHDTWHGFEPRPMNGVRRSLIVNYVTREWRNRHELVYPDVPIG